jgi:Zn-dependent protease with chaperone function
MKRIFLFIVTNLALVSHPPLDARIAALRSTAHAAPA